MGVNRSMTSIRAKIHFFSSAEGGRRSPPSGPTYSTVGRAEGADDTTGRWSMVLTFEGAPDAGGDVVAQVRYLVPDAPHHQLLTARTFELFEGGHRVAVGVVQPPLP